MFKISSIILIVFLLSAIYFTTGLVQAVAPTTVGLGTAGTFAILAGTPNITDVPVSVIKGNVGLSPASGAGIGLTCSEVTGTIYSVDAAGPLPCRVTNPALLTTAQNDLKTAYDDAASRTPTSTFSVTDNQLGGKTLNPGVYAFGHGDTANLTAESPLTLDAKGDPNAVFIFQASSDLVTSSGSVVRIVNGAQSCNIFWQVKSNATLGTNSTFIGNILALSSIAVTTGVTIDGSVLARNGAVTLDQDTITKNTCATVATTPTATTSATPTTSSNSPSVLAATTSTPKLPNTGFNPKGNTLPWGIPLGIFLAVVSSFYLISRLLNSKKI